MKAISLGWGVQSFTLAAMVALGELEPVDVAIHADTTHERSATYEFAVRWQPWLEAHGVGVAIVRSAHVNDLKDYRIGIPAFTKSEPGTVKLIPEMDLTWGEDGEEYEEPTGRMIEVTPNMNGQLRRQCTHKWKIIPIRRHLQAIRNGQPVEQWIGISLDEWQRMKDSDVKYITHRWPLIEKRMTRKDCMQWLREHDLEVPPKSSCVFCPYHNRRAWEEMRSEGGADWWKAVDVDRAIRKVRPPYDLYVHASRKPLDSLDLRTPQERGQLELWADWDAECSGVCGV